MEFPSVVKQLIYLTIISCIDKKGTIFLIIGNNLLQVWDVILSYLEPRDMKNLRLTKIWSGDQNDSPILQRLLKNTFLTVNSEHFDLFKQQVRPSLAPKNIKLDAGVDISELANDPTIPRMDIRTIDINAEFSD